MGRSWLLRSFAKIMEWTAVKKGWVYQRKKHLFLPTSWSPKYLVLYSGPVAALAVYEQRSDAMPPYAPLLHIELTGGHVSVGTAHGNTAGNGFWSAVGQSVASRKASIVSTLSRKGSFRDLNGASAYDLGQDGAKTKSYKERVLDDQGFTVHREAHEGQGSLKLCFATESKEERDAWLCEIGKIIDQANRKHQNLFTVPEPTTEENVLLSQMKNMSTRTESADLSITCYGIKIMDHRTVKRILKRSIDQLDHDEDEDEQEEIKISQILESSNSRLGSSNGLIPDDLNLRYQQAIDDKRRLGGDEKHRAEIKLMKFSGIFSQAVSGLVKRTIDALHTNKAPLVQGTLHEDHLCRVQFIADYQAGCDDEEARAWLQAEMLATRWINAQDGVHVHSMVMASVEYKGFKAVGMLKLPVSSQATLEFDVSGGAEDDPIVSEAALAIMRELAKELHLLPSYPWRLSDGRTIQMALHPTVQLHHVQSHTMAPNSGVMVVGRQAGKIQGGTAACTFTPPGHYLLNLGEILPQLHCGNGFVRPARPELLRLAKNAAGSGALHPEATNNALQGLLRDAISGLCKDLEEDLSITPLDSLQWTELLHARGINCCLLGLLAQNTKLPHVQEGLIMEMLGRTMKRAVRSQLRQTVLHFREVQALLVEEELANIAVSAVNVLFSPDIAGNREWKQQLLNAVEAFYGYRVDLERVTGLPRVALFLAVQHHCGIQFKAEAVQFVAEGSLLLPGHLIRFTPKCSGVFELRDNQDIDEEEALKLNLASQAFSVNKHDDLAKALMAGNLERLARSTRDETTAKLAKNLCPSFHAQMAFAMLTELDLSRDGFDLVQAIRTHEQASQILKGHLGDHHPLQLVLSETFTDILSLKSADTETLWEALRVRQLILRDAAKILGKSHGKTKGQYKRLGDLHLQLGDWEGAIGNYRQALGLHKDIEYQIEVSLRLAEAFGKKEDTEAALGEVQRCKELIEREIPRRAASDPEGRQRLLKTQEDVLLLLAKLSQSVLEDAPSFGDQQMISSAVEKHLMTSIQCYERLFESQRSRAENPSEGQKLIDLLQSIFKLKLRLAQPAARTVITLAAKQQSACPVDDKTIHDMVVKLLTGPSTPSVFMDKLLEQAACPETMKDVEAELKSVIQFTSSL